MTKGEGEGRTVGEAVEAFVTDGLAAGSAELVESGDYHRAQAKAVVAMVRAGVKEAGAGVVRLLSDTPDRRLAAAVEEDFDRDLQGVAPELEQKLQDLVDDPDVDTGNLSSSAATVANEVLQAYARTADARKKRILLAVLVSAFDKDAYEEGLTVGLLRILDVLDYGDLRLLQALADQGGTLRLTSKTFDAGTLEREHARRLQTQNLITLEEKLSARLASASQFTANVTITELGSRMLRLVEGGLPVD